MRNEVEGRLGEFDGETPEFAKPFEPGASSAPPPLPDDALSDEISSLIQSLYRKPSARSSARVEPSLAPATGASPVEELRDLLSRRGADLAKPIPIAGPPPPRTGAARRARCMGGEVFDVYRHAALEIPTPPNGLDLAELVAWSENEEAPTDTPDNYAMEVAWIVLRYGTSSDLPGGAVDDGVADVQERTEQADAIWANRAALFAERARLSDAHGYVRGLPWIAARVQLAATTDHSSTEADKSMARLAAMDGMDAWAMCAEIGRAKGLRPETVDLVLWTSFAYGVGG